MKELATKVEEPIFREMWKDFRERMPRSVKELGQALGVGAGFVAGMTAITYGPIYAVAELINYFAR